eukprot:TRINITY_DN6914_c0_g1_i1.p1 TRINITY_DN6914_c0_g1~~TRINITY_DN6914_c0_g1_i1.p1  ORF type:complete len:660 (+),score=291.30 TRINITY_DN6914_c0_g1_i1:115-1980(+)
MSVVVTYFNATDPLIQGLEKQLLPVVEQLVPELVCEQVHAIVNDTLGPLVNAIVAEVGDFLNAVEDSDAPPKFNLPGFLWGLGGGLGIFFALVLYYLVVDVLEWRRKRRQFEVVGGERPAEDTGLLKGRGATENTDEDGNTTCAIMRDTRIHWLPRYVLPLVSLLNLSLFVSATVSVGTRVYVYLTIGESVTKLPSLYTFTLWSSVIEMWEAGVWPLALLIAGTSGVWPYVKLVLMLLCWLLPPQVLAVGWRRAVLQWLDALGKWSLIDAYVLVLFLEAFRIHVAIGEGLAFDMVAEAHYGYFSYLGATMLSLSLCHVVLYAHNYLEDPPLRSVSAESVGFHSYALGRRVLTFTIGGVLAVVVVVVATVAAVVLGELAEGFEFSYEGSLIGVLLEKTGEAATKAYSVFDLVDAIPKTSFDSPNEIGIRVIQVTYVLFTIAFPFAHLLLLLVIWLVPMRGKVQHVLFMMIEVAGAWSALDVFMVSVVVALLELEQFAEFIVGQKCDGLNQFLSTFFPDGPSDGQCLTVTAALGGGSYILIGAVIVLLVVGYSMMFLCNRALDERMQREAMDAVWNDAEGEHADIHKKVTLPVQPGALSRVLSSVVKYSCALVGLVRLRDGDI